MDNETLTTLLTDRLGDDWEIAGGPATTHQIELISGRTIEYTDGGCLPDDFDPETQIWIRVKPRVYAADI